MGKWEKWPTVALKMQFLKQSTPLLLGIKKANSDGKKFQPFCLKLGKNWKLSWKMAKILAFSL